MSFVKRTIYDRFTTYVEMNRIDNSLIAKKEEAMEYIDENGWCRVGVVPTIKGFQDVALSKSQKDPNVYVLNGDWLCMDRIIYRPNGKNNPEYGIYSDYMDAIKAAKEKLQRIGDLCVVFYRHEDDKDRMFLDHDFYSRVFTKNGWWDTFTLKSGEKVDIHAGKRYLAHIKEFCLDKDGYPILIVEPFFELGQDKLIDAYIFNHYNRFVVESGSVEENIFYRLTPDLNFAEAYKIPFEKFESDPTNPNILEEIRSALKSPTRKELNLQSLRKAAEENPKVAKKMANCGGLREYAEIVEDSYYNLRYQGLVPEAEWLGEKALLIIEHYEKKKAEEKAARKAAKELRKRNS